MLKPTVPDQKGTSKANANSTRRVAVESGGTGVVAHVGLHALERLADGLGLGEALSSAVPWRGAGVALHDRGKVLVQMALVLAGGGESCLDIEHLRTGDDLFGSVPSDTTAARTFHEITASTRDDIAVSLAKVRAEVWRRAQAVNGAGPVILDIDASLVQIHSENKEQAAPTFKGGYAYHPMFCFADGTKETLAALLRPGNAGANTVADHLRVLDAAIAQLPEDVAAGHRAGEDPGLVKHRVVVRADSAGCTEGFLSACRTRNVGFYVSARSNTQVTAAIFDAIGVEEVWLRALAQDGEDKEGAHVAELTSLIDDDKLPEGTRLIVRREPLHPGAQRSLFPSLDYRYWGFYTDQDGDPRDLDVTMRAHAHVEQHIARLKDSGLTRFPFTSFEANANWLLAVTLSADLVRWFQLLCVEGAWRDARPKGPSLEHLPRPRTSRAHGAQADRPHHRRLADHRRPPRRLPAHRTAHLTRHPARAETAPGGLGTPKGRDPVTYRSRHMAPSTPAPLPTRSRQGRGRPCPRNAGITEPSSGSVKRTG